MKIDFLQPFKTLGGETIHDPEGKPFTLKSACVNSLLSDDSNAKVKGEEKAERYMLALAIHNATEPLEISVENVAKLKQLVGNTYTTLIVGQAWEMLDPK